MANAQFQHFGLLRGGQSCGDCLATARAGHGISCPHHCVMPPAASRRRTMCRRMGRRLGIRRLRICHRALTAPGHTSPPRDVQAGLTGAGAEQRYLAHTPSAPDGAAHAEFGGHHTGPVNPAAIRTAAAAHPCRVFRHALFAAPTHAGSIVSKFEFRNIIRRTVGAAGYSQAACCVKTG